MRFFAIAAASGLAVGCVAGGDGTSSTSQYQTSWNKLAANKLAANKLAANKLAANKLAANKLAINPAGAGELLATPDGRYVLSYIVSCAVAADTTLVYESSNACTQDSDCADGGGTGCTNGLECGNGTFSGACSASNTCTYSFSGVVGVTPDWVDERLDTTGKHWESACLFSRVNGHDTAEEISLRGENSALTVSTDEQALYSLEEGAFWGNLFTGHNKPILWNACTGRDNTGGISGGLTLRECARPDPANPGYTMCGFNYAGDCGAYNPALPNAPHACREFESQTDHGSFYEGCAVPAPARAHQRGIDGDDHHGDGDGDGRRARVDRDDSDDDDDGNDSEFDVFEEVVTTFVAP